MYILGYPVVHKYKVKTAKASKIHIIILLKCYSNFITCIVFTVEFRSSCPSSVMSDARLTAVSPAQLVSDTGKVINSMLYKHRLFAIIIYQTSVHDITSKTTLITRRINFILD